MLSKARARRNSLAAVNIGSLIVVLTFMKEASNGVTQGTNTQDQVVVCLMCRPVVHVNMMLAKLLVMHVQMYWI